MGASTDLESEGLRRLVVNAAYWCVGLEDKIPAKANVDVLRSVLASYAADSDTNRYPTGNMDFSAIKTLLPVANLPGELTDAKWQSFTYAGGTDGTSFTITVTANDRAFDTIIGTPSGISPSVYPH